MTWLVEHPGVFGDVGVALLVADRWVHKREDTEEQHTERLTRLDKAVDAIQIEGSVRYSQIVGRIMSLELDVRELQAVVRIRRRTRSEEK